MNDEMPKSAELLSISAALAGAGATDDEIGAQFPRALILLNRAESWLSPSNALQRDADLDSYIYKLAEVADASDPIRPWSDSEMLKAAGYGDDYSHPQTGKGKVSCQDKGVLLWQCFDRQLRRKFKPEDVSYLRQKWRNGMELSRLKMIWPQLSKWRERECAGQLPDDSANTQDNQAEIPDKTAQ
jgi:hypothetical protein